MNAAFALRERAHAREHSRAYKRVLERFTGSRCMGTDDIILQFSQMVIFHAPLCHWSKTGVNTVDNLIAQKTLQESKALGNAFSGCFIPNQLTIPVEDVVHQL